MSASSFEDPYLQSILERTAQKEGFKKPKFSITSGSKPGDNYCGRIYRTLISETDKTNSELKPLSLIFKVSPLSKVLQEKTTSQKLFRRETDVYQTVLPTLNKILNKYGVVKSDVFPGTAKCYASYLEKESCQVIVLEDKIADGFRTVGDVKALDADRCRLILKKVAMWHAASLAWQQHDREATERINNLLATPTLFSDIDCPIVGELKLSAFEGLTLLQDPCKRGNSTFETLESLVQNYHDEMLKTNEVFSDLASIIHGDCWFNNVLYKYDKDDSFQDVCLIDHQATRLASPAVDVSYMLFLCTTKDVRDASYDELIHVYHDEMTSLLRKMDCDPDDIFPWDRLQNHLKKCGRIGVLMALSTFHVGLVDSLEHKIDGQTSEKEENVLVGRAKASDEKKMEEISRRTTDVIIDALRLGYI